MINNKLKNDPLKIIFEKHLFSGELHSTTELQETVLNYFFEYLEQAKFIIRKKDEDQIRDELKYLIQEMIKNTIGSMNNIKNFLAEYKNIEQKKNETYEKYIQLYIELEESVNP